MSSKLSINHLQNRNTSIKITINILVISILGSIAPFPAQATLLQNIPPAEQLNSNNNQFFQITPKNPKLLSSNPENQNELQSRLLADVQDTINEVKEADKFTKETIGNKTVYLYNSENIKPSSFSNSVNISGANQVRWRLPAPKQARKIPESSTVISLVLAFFLFALRYRLKQA